MACATNFVRYLFFVFNLIIWILGVVVLGVGIYSLVQNGRWKDLLHTNTMFTAANLLIAAGVIVSCLGFLGCCGACFKWQWMLVIYSFLVFLIFILEIAAGIYAYTKRGKVTGKLKENVKKAITNEYGKGDKASITSAIDFIQEEVECCGATGPTDWLDSYWYKHNNTEGAQVPKSCCRTVTPKCNMNASSRDVYNEGCVEAAQEFVEKNMKLIGGVGIGIAVVQLLGIISAMCLCSAFRRDERGEPIMG